MEEKQNFKVTQKDVEASIVAEQFFKLGAKTTVCLLILNTGYEVIGSSSVIDQENFDFAVGKEIAREKAMDGVWDHIGSIVQWKKAIYDQSMLEAQAEQAKKKAEMKVDK